MISFIVVDYKTISKTLAYIGECYQKVADSDKMHTIIVDNREDTVAGMQQLEELTGNPLQQLTELETITVPCYIGKYANREFLYVSAGKNLGYAKGNNLGARIAEAYYKDAYYLFSNNDLRFPETIYLDTLLQPMQRNRKIAVTGPRIVTPAGEQQTPRKRIGACKQLFLYYVDILLPKRIKFTKHITDVDNSNSSKFCYWVTGSFMMADAEKFQEVGGFDEHTFLFCEEAILAERLLRKGYQVYYVNDVTVIHEHGQTIKSAFRIVEGIEISFRSALYYYRTYRGLSSRRCILAKLHFKLFKLLFIGKKAIGHGIARLKK